MQCNSSPLTFSAHCSVCAMWMLASCSFYSSRTRKLCQPLCEIHVETWVVQCLSRGKLLVCLRAATIMGDGWVPWPTASLLLTLLIHSHHRLWGLLPVLITNIFHVRKRVIVHRASWIWWVEIRTLSVISSSVTCIADCRLQRQRICRFYLGMFCIAIYNVHCWLRSKSLS